MREGWSREASLDAIEALLVRMGDELISLWRGNRLDKTGLKGVWTVERTGTRRLVIVDLR